MRWLLSLLLLLVFIPEPVKSQPVAVYADLIATNPNEAVTQILSWGKVDCLEQVQVFLEVILTEGQGPYATPYEVRHDNSFGIGTVSGGSEHGRKLGSGLSFFQLIRMSRQPPSRERAR